MHAGWLNSQKRLMRHRPIRPLVVSNLSQAIKEHNENWERLEGFLRQKAENEDANFELLKSKFHRMDENISDWRELSFAEISLIDRAHILKLNEILEMLGKLENRQVKQFQSLEILESSIKNHVSITKNSLYGLKGDIFLEMNVLKRMIRYSWVGIIISSLMTATLIYLF